MLWIASEQEISSHARPQLDMFNVGIVYHIPQQQVKAVAIFMSCS